MGNSLGDKLSKLYAGQGIYVRFYVWARAKFLNLDYCSQFLPHNGLLIDVGCGYGVMANYLSLRFPHSQVIGIDLKHKRIDVALKTVGKRKNITFLLKNVMDWAFPSCAGVAMTDFLHHISRREQELILHKVFHSLGKGEILLILEVDPTTKPFYRYWASYLADRVLYPLSGICYRRPSDWERRLSNLGFSVKTIKIRNPIFAPILYVCHK